MSYRLKKADGNTVIIKDYESQIVGGLTLLGYGFANYGDEVAQNFIKELENNAGTVEPTAPLLGQFWFFLPQDLLTGNKELRACLNPSGASVSLRWKTLFSITPAGDMLLDAYTLRGMGPVKGNGVGNGPNDKVVILDSNGKINSEYLPSAGGPATLYTDNVQ